MHFMNSFSNLQGWKYHTKVSFLEIYNETIRDLLANPNEAENFHYEIRLIDNKKTDIYVSNLKVGIFKFELFFYILYTKLSEND